MVNLGETSYSNNGYLGQYAKVVYNASDLTGDKPATRIRDNNGIRYYDDGENTVVVLYPISNDMMTVSLDSRTTEIQPYAFSYCRSLTSITIPDSVTSIGDLAFNYCDSLTAITIPEGVTNIGSKTFSYCDGLTSITNPSSVIRIGRRAFENCSNLASVTFENTTGWFRTTSSTATSGTSIDVSNPETNATNLKTTYYNSYWKRS